MDLKDIFAISGKPGLYKFISQGRNSVMIVENLEDKKRITAFTTAKISSLEDIAVFTDTEDMALKDVLKAIYEKENGAASSIDHKSSGKVLEKYFDEIIPTYDRKRVYASDIKKVVLWYNILQKLELLDFSEDKENKDGKDKEEQDEKQNKNIDKEPKKEPKKELKKKPEKRKGKITTVRQRER